MRRCFQFGLQTAMLLMAVIAVPCGWLGANLRQWQEERRVLAAIGPALVEDASRPFFLELC